MPGDQHQLGFVAGTVGAFGNVFIYRQLCALRGLRPFVACMNYVNRDLYPFEPVHVLRSTGVLPRAANWGLTLLPRRLRWTDAIEAPRVFSELLRDYRPELLYIHFGWTAVRVAKVLLRGCVPYILVLHGSDVNQAVAHPRSRYARWLRLCFDGAERCLFVSEHLRQKGVALGCPETKATVHYLGVPVPERVPALASHHPPRATCIARFIDCKGHDLLLHAFARVLTAGPDVTLRLIGEGPLRAPTEALARKLGLDGRVTFQGGIPNEKVYDELCNTDLYVQPSRRLSSGEEGLGLAVQEAMAAGVPVVATRTGGIPESVAHGVTGLLVEDGDVDGLAEAMRVLVLDSALRRKMGDAGRQRVAEVFNVQTQNAKLVEMLRGFLKEGH
jgi:glycosyltransferase involved in cell wall biosynthesis